MRTDRLTSLLAASLLFGLAGAGVPAAKAETGTAADAQRSIDWQAQPVRLLMVDQQGCIYCAAWRREIGPGYPKSSEGQAAPLLVVDIDGPWPDGLALARRPTITPTFVLLQQGQELARLEGYPGDQYFYPLIARMLTDAGIGAGAKEAGG